MATIDHKEICDWILKQIASQQISQFNTTLWIPDIHTKSIADFTNNQETKKLLAYIDSLDGKLYFQTDLPKYHSGEFVYIMKRENPLEAKNLLHRLNEVFVVGKVKADDPIESLYTFMTGQNLSTLIEQSKWPEGNIIFSLTPTFLGVRREFMGHLQKFLASLTEVVHQVKGSTVLYIPEEDLNDVDKAALDKDLVHRLECKLI
jgi:dynein heavy chain